MQPLPNLQQPFVETTGKIKSPWNYYLQQFTQAPAKILNITVDGSPFEYEAVEPGLIAVAGGTVSIINLTRGLVSINVTGVRLIPVSINDVVEVTYSVLPTIQFIPSYGQRTG